MKALKEILKNCMDKIKQDSKIYNAFMDYKLGLAACLLTGAPAGHSFEHLVIKSAIDSD